MSNSILIPPGLNKAKAKCIEAGLPYFKMELEAHLNRDDSSYCENCEGSGREYCRECDGDAHWECDHGTYNSETHTYDYVEVEACGRCDSDGDQECSHCSGQGYWDCDSCPDPDENDLSDSGIEAHIRA